MIPSSKRFLLSMVFPASYNTYATDIIDSLTCRRKLDGKMYAYMFVAIVRILFVTPFARIEYP